MADAIIPVETFDESRFELRRLKVGRSGFTPFLFMYNVSSNPSKPDYRRFTLQLGTEDLGPVKVIVAPHKSELVDADRWNKQTLTCGVSITKLQYTKIHALQSAIKRKLEAYLRSEPISVPQGGKTKSVNASCQVRSFMKEDSGVYETPAFFFDVFQKKPLQQEIDEGVIAAAAADHSSVPVKLGIDVTEVVCSADKKLDMIDIVHVGFGDEVCIKFHFGPLTSSSTGVGFKPRCAQMLRVSKAVIRSSSKFEWKRADGTMIDLTQAQAAPPRALGAEEEAQAEADAEAQAQAQAEADAEEGAAAGAAAEAGAAYDLDDAAAIAAAEEAEADAEAGAAEARAAEAAEAAEAATSRAAAAAAAAAAARPAAATNKRPAAEPQPARPAAVKRTK
jgi:hypothetical protein